MATLTNRPSLGLARVATGSRPITRHRRMTVSATAREVPISSGDQTNWHTAKTLPLSRLNLRDLFQNRIPDVRVRNFLSADECQSLVNIIKTHQIVHSLVVDGFFRI